MRSEFKIITAIFGIVIFVSAFSLYLKLTKKDFHLLSPISDSFSLLSYFQNPRPPTHIIYGFLPYWRLFETDSLKLNDLTDIAYFGLRINADGSFQQYVNSYELEPGYNNWRNNEDLTALISTAQSSGVRFSLTVISLIFSK